MPESNQEKNSLKKFSHPFNSRMGSHHFFLLAIIFWIFGANIIWMLLDIRPPSYDQGLHLFRTYNYWEAITSGSEDWWQDVLNVEPFYPPFYHLSLIPFSLIFGFTLDTGVIGNLFYIIVLALSTYGIGKILYSKDVGLFSAFLISFFPAINFISREYIINTMLMALTSLTYFLFLKTENFENRKYSLLFNLVYASGLMVKWTFFIYTLPVVLTILWGDKTSFRERIVQLIYYSGMIAALLIVPFLIFIFGSQKWIFLILEFFLIGVLIKFFPKTSISSQKAINLTSLSCISVLICFPWYAHNLINILIGLSKFAFSGADPEGAGVSWNIPNWAYYLQVIGSQMGHPMMIIFAVTFLFYFIKKDRINWTLLNWIFFSIIVFTFVDNKDIRYTMPTLPAMAIITAVVLSQVNNANLRKSLYVITGITVMLTFFFTSFFHRPSFFPYLGHENLPITQSWPINRILDDIIEEKQPTEGKNLSVRTLANFAYFQRGSFRDFAAFRNLPITMKGVKRNVGEMTDFFITKSGDFSRQSANAIHLRKILLNDPALTKTFKLFRKYPLPDGTNGLVYKFDMEPAYDLPRIADLEFIGDSLIKALEIYPIYGVKKGVNITATIIPSKNPQDLYYGRYKSIHIKADSAISNKVKIEDFELLFENVQINIYDLLLNGKFILFDLEKLTPKGTIYFDDLEKTATKAMKGKGEAKVTGSKNSITIHAKYALSSDQVIEGKAKVNILMEPEKKIWPEFEYLRLGTLDIPILFVRRITNTKLSLQPTPGWPLVTNIKNLKISPRKIEINPNI
ncbi:MAG: phospholipid carrier-dependent glycosyltransferase [Nitrospinae bacterium]|nr:phospholipid carrier-dependent glycosyltransferase [Nitrospinota bacterium]